MIIILSRFLQFLEWIERVQAFIQFLTEPIGLSLSVAILLYFILQPLGCDRLSASTLSSSLALSLFYVLTQPSF